MTIEQLDAIGPRRAQLQAQLEAAEARSRQAREDLGRTRIVSPMAGVIQTIDVEVGESVTAGQRVARVVATDVVEIGLKLPAASRSAVKVGDPVTLSAGSGRQWEGTIERLSPETDRETRTLTAWVELAGEDVPAPGDFVTATVSGSRVAARLVVPRGAVQDGQLYLVRNGRVESRRVNVDFTVEAKFDLVADERQWAVLDREAPVEPGLSVLINASSAVVGQAVEPVDAAVPAEMAGVTP